MSEAKKLSTALLESAESLSLAGTDRILAFDTTGQQKKISRANLLSSWDINPQAEGWIRLLSYNVAGDVLLSVSNGWSTLKGNFVLFAAMMHASPSDYSKVTTLVNMSNSGTGSFSKIRVIKKSASEGYLDIWYPGSTAAQSVRVTILCSRNVTRLTPEYEAQIPEGYTAVELDITKPAWGGVKRSASIGYKLNPKGGVQHDRSHTPQRRAYTLLVDRGTILGVAKADPFGRDTAADSSKLLHRGLYPTRDISVGCKHHDLGDTTVTKRVMALRNHGSVRPECGHNPKDNRYRGGNDVHPHTPQRQVEALETDPSRINLTSGREVACI